MGLIGRKRKEQSRIEGEVYTQPTTQYSGLGPLDCAGALGKAGCDGTSETLIGHAMLPPGQIGEILVRVQKY
jgi:hypothetical protein